MNATSRLPLATSIFYVVALVSCTEAVRPPATRFEISVAPLTLPGIAKVCYDLQVKNGTTALADTVWQQGDPLVTSPTDTDAICSSNFGNGTGGDVTFVGTCDATKLSPSDSGRINAVTVWVDSLYDASGPISANGSDGWRNPCPNGCTLEALCQENADTPVTFNLTILRQANQGFFDIGVNFEDVFCSAKVDCTNAAGEPLDLLFRPSTSTRDTTIVSALACTGGPGNTLTTHLFRDPLVVTCQDGSSATLPIVPSKGNVYTASNPDPNAADAVWQYAIYSGEEALNCGGSSCNKVYWNVAIGLDETRDNCTLKTKMSAGSEGTFVALTTPAKTTYPYIDVEVPLTNAVGLTCGKHALNEPGSGVSTVYTSISSTVTFASTYSKLVDECALGLDNCHADAVCTDTPSAFSCACATGYTGNGVTCADVNECSTSNGGCSANATCTNLPGTRSCACNAGFTGDGITCTAMPVTTSLIVHLDATNPASYGTLGTTWTDISGNGNNFTLVNGPVWTQGQYVEFDGSNDFAVSANNINLSAYDYIVVDIAVKSNSLNGGMAFEHTVNWNTNPGSFGLALHSSGSGPLTNTHHTNCSMENTGRNYQGSAGTGWAHHINMYARVSDATGRLTWFNGARVPFVSPYPTPTATPGGFTFANAKTYLASRGGAGGFLNGRIASFKMYGMKFTDANALQNFNAIRGSIGL